MRKNEEEKGPIMINPEKMLKIIDRILEDEEFRKKGLDGVSFYKIDNDLHKEGITKSKRSLTNFIKDYPRLLKFMKEVQKKKFFQRLSLLKIQSDRFVLGKERLLAEGNPIALGPHPPLGYKIVNGLYELDQESVPLAKQLFEIFYIGGNMAQFARKTRYSVTALRRMIRNRLYIGFIRFGKTERRFPDLAIIDEELWKECQEVSHVRLRYGFMRKGKQTLIKPETSLKIVQIFDLRLQHKTMAEIARITNLKRSLVWAIIRDPTYANKIKVEGKPPDEWPDAGVEPIISFETWLKAQKIFSDRPSWSLALEAKKKKKIANQNQLLAYIGSREPEGVRFVELKELIQKMGRTESQLKRYLSSLRAHGLIQKRVRHWHVKGERDIQREMVCEIYRLRREGKSLQKIARALGISTTPVHRILRNPNCKDVVGEELWEAVQKIKSEPQPSQSFS